MASVYISTANAVVSAINAGTSYVRTFTAVRGYDVTADLEYLRGELRVDVVPAKLEQLHDPRVGSRSTFEYRVQIDVGIRYKFAPSDNANDGQILLDEIDAYIELLEQINEHLKSRVYRHLPDYPVAGLRQAEIRAPWLPKHLINLRQYTGFLRLTYAIERDLS